MGEPSITFVRLIQQARKEIGGQIPWDPEQFLAILDDLSGNEPFWQMELMNRLVEEKLFYLLTGVSAAETPDEKQQAIETLERRLNAMGCFSRKNIAGFLRDCRKGFGWQVRLPEELEKEQRLARQKQEEIRRKSEQEALHNVIKQVADQKKQQAPRTIYLARDQILFPHLNNAVQRQANPQPKSRPKTQTTSQTKSQSTSQTKSQTTSRTKSQSTSQAKPQTTSRAKPQTTSQTKPRSTSQAKSQSKSQTTSRPNGKRRKSGLGKHIFWWIIVLLILAKLLGGLLSQLYIVPDGAQLPPPEGQTSGIWSIIPDEESRDLGIRFIAERK